MNIVCSWHVANTFIKKAFEEGIYFTPLKLNCLIYLLYSNYLYNTGKALFNEPFLKTSKGPILVNIEAKFGSFKERKIFEYAKDSTGTVYLLSGDDFLASLLYIWNLYKNMSDIEMLTFLNNTRSFWKSCVKLYD